MDRPVEQGFSPSRALSVYVTVMVLSFAFCLVAGFSIGLFFLPVPAAMAIGLLFWQKKWLVSALVVGALAGSFAYLLTAPLWRGITATARGGVVTEITNCGRTILPDLPGSECDDANRQAVAYGVGSGLLAAMATGLVVRSATRRDRP